MKKIFTVLIIPLLFLSCSKKDVKDNTEIKLYGMSIPDNYLNEEKTYFSMNKIIEGLNNNDQIAFDILVTDFSNKPEISFSAQIDDLFYGLSKEAYCKLIREMNEAGVNLGGTEYARNVWIITAELGYTDLIEYLGTTSLINEINLKFNCYGPPLFWAIYKNHYDTAEALLKLGANPNQSFFTFTCMKEVIPELVEDGNISESEKWVELLDKYSN